MTEDHDWRAGHEPDRVQREMEHTERLARELVEARKELIEAEQREAALRAALAECQATNGASYGIDWQNWREAAQKLADLRAAAQEAERTIVNCRAVIKTLEKKPSMASVVVPAILTETEMVLNNHLRPALTEKKDGA